jgi:hypothetical protein
VDHKFMISYYTAVLQCLWKMSWETAKWRLTGSSWKFICSMAHAHKCNWLQLQLPPGLWTLLWFLLVPKDA